MTLMNQNKSVSGERVVVFKTAKQKKVNVKETIKANTSSRPEMIAIILIGSGALYLGWQGFLMVMKWLRGLPDEVLDTLTGPFKPGEGKWFEGFSSVEYNDDGTIKRSEPITWTSFFESFSKPFG